MDIILIIIVGALIIGFPLFLIGKLLFRRKISQEGNIKATKKHFIIAFVTVSLLLILMWFVEAGHKWAAITVSIVVIISVLYRTIFIHSNNEQ